MKKSHWKTLLGIALVNCLALPAEAQTKSPVQSTVKPNNTTVVGSVYEYASDTLSSSYHSNQSTYLSLINSKLQEGVAFTGEGLNQLDPTKLYFFFSYAPRVYFIYGYAGYIDGLGATIATVAAPTSGNLTGNTFTIFPDAHWNGSTSRSQTYPPLQGDFVQLPTVNAGQQLAFYLYSNINTSNNSVGNIFYNGASNNPDGFQHMIAFFPDNSQYIIIGFEDMYGGGDQDCNDLMFVVDIGPNNAAALRNVSTMPK
jgi:hypothetical protein